jgi:hypothetical protein
LLFLPHSVFFFLRSLVSCASLLDQGTEKELRHRRPPARRRLCSPSYDIFTFITAAASPLLDITMGDWIFDYKLTAAPLPSLELRYAFPSLFFLSHAFL